MVQSTPTNKSEGSAVRTRQLPRIRSPNRDLFYFMYYLYILFSDSRDKYYVGHTNDISCRLKKHNTNHDGFTGKTGHWEIAYNEIFNTKEQAIKGRGK